MRNHLWSKMKKRLESFVCDSLKDRMQFTVANYRKAHDQMGRVFITVDKKEVFNMCTITSDIALYQKEREIRRSENIPMDVYNTKQNRDIGDLAYQLITAEGIFAQYDFFDALEEYFNLPIESSLKSNNKLIKLFAILDRRVGKRTLKKVKEEFLSEIEILQYFYQLRCESEGITIHN